MQNTFSHFTELPIGKKFFRFADFFKSFSAFRVSVRIRPQHTQGKKTCSGLSGERPLVHKAPATMLKRGLAIGRPLWQSSSRRSSVADVSQRHQPYQQPTSESHRQKLTSVFEDIEKQIKLPVDHFLINNLVQSEDDISSFAIQRANKMRPILQQVKHPIYEVARQLFVADRLQLDGDSLQDFLNQNQLSLGAVVLLLNAHCLANVPAYNQTAAREHWQPIDDPKSAGNSFRFECNSI